MIDQCTTFKTVPTRTRGGFCGHSHYSQSDEQAAKAATTIPILNRETYTKHPNNTWQPEVVDASQAI